MKENNFNDDKTSASDWARAELKKDSEYWRDRAMNGNGIIHDIAIFVMREGAK